MWTCVALWERMALKDRFGAEFAMDWLLLIFCVFRLFKSGKNLGRIIVEGSTAAAETYE